MLERGRVVFFAVATALVATVLGTLGRLPPLVASHFDARGVPNGWSTRPLYALFILAIGILVPLGITWLITLLTRSGVAALNIPAKDYWTRPEHTPEAVHRVRGYMWWLACVLAITALLIHWSVLAANARRPPGLGSAGFFAILGGVVLALGIWTAGWYRLLRRPGGDRK
ncbi:MAG TPA: DUF1648 domain-containing protein [Gemmatimonadales bacterium]